MSKFTLFPLLLIALFLGACEDESEFANMADQRNQSLDNPGKAYGRQRNCLTMKILEDQLAQHPGLARKMAMIEAHTRAYENAKNGGGKGKPGGGGGSDPAPSPYEGTVTIPVVVHVIYRTSQENISETQIKSQISVLNEDFGATNNDISQVPAFFSELVADTEVNFELAQIIRKSTTRTSWSTSDDMKFTSRGGSDAWDASQYLNIWVCNLSGGILGYAQFPGGSAATDGVVVTTSAFGSTGYVEYPFDKGRTATHEVGHWLNLRHIWGDGPCRQDDYVADTPNSNTANYGCPTFPTVHCRTTDMTMNYMDYTNDACMYMFSRGQKDRMRALFAAGGARESLILAP